VTSLPPGAALYHLDVKIGQRSAGKSALAAAAYRAGQRLYDERLGREYDYTRKRNIVDTFVLAPPGAPDWCQNRAALWNAAEAAERRKDATIWREVEVSIPRDLPRDQWRQLVEGAVAPYLACGCVVDVALHAPQGADGGENGHAHILLTTRAIGPDGFAAKKNSSLEEIFRGPKGTPHGEALRIERARWADAINSALRAAESNRRVDARSYAERGVDRAAEPTMGERDARRYARNRRPSARQRHVGALRALHKIENQILEMECNMVKETKIPYAGSRQKVKLELLRERLPPDLDLSPYKDAVYMVDVRDQNRTRIQLRDDSWVEIDHKAERIKTWGPAHGGAVRFADATADALGWQRDTVTRLPTSARTLGPGRRLDADAVKTRAEWWREQGFADVTVTGHRVLVAVGPSRLIDFGDKCELHGPITEDAVRAMVTNAATNYGTPPRARTWGSPEFRAMYWLEAQRQGVTVVDYEPPEHVRAAWEAEQAKTARAGAAVAAVSSKADLARAVRAFAAGDVEKPPTPALGAVIDALTPDQRARIARAEPYEIVPQLAGLQQRGAALIADQQSAGDRPEALAEHAVETVAPAAVTALVPRP